MCILFSTEIMETNAIVICRIMFLPNIYEYTINISYLSLCISMVYNALNLLNDGQTKRSCALLKAFSRDFKCKVKR